MYTSFNGTKTSNADLVEKAGLQSHANCSPYLAHVQANLKSKIRAEFKMAQELDIVLPHVQKLQNKETRLKDAATQITEDRQSIELELEEKRKQLKTMFCSFYCSYRLTDKCSWSVTRCISENLGSL